MTAGGVAEQGDRAVDGLWNTVDRLVGVHAINPCVGPAALQRPAQKLERAATLMASVG